MGSNPICGPMWGKKVTERERVLKAYGQWLCSNFGNPVTYIVIETGVPAQRVRDILLGRQ